MPGTGGELPSEHKSSTTWTSSLKKRLFVGNLHEEISSDDLKQRFQNFGTVELVDLRNKNESTFAFIDIIFEGDRDLKKCIDVLNNAKWKGLLLKVQVAKENFLDKLKLEREQAKAQRAARRPRPPDNFDFEIVTSNTITSDTSEPKKKKLAEEEKVTNGTSFPTRGTRGSRGVLATEEVKVNGQLHEENADPKINNVKSKKTKSAEKAPDSTVGITDKSLPANAKHKREKLPAPAPATPVAEKPSSSSSDSNDSSSGDEDEPDNDLHLPMFKGILAYPSLQEIKPVPVPAEEHKPSTSSSTPSKQKPLIETIADPVTAPPNPPLDPKPTGSSGGMKLNPLKKQKSDALRLQSLQSRQELKKSREAIVSRALSNSVLVEQHKQEELKKLKSTTPEKTKSVTTISQNFLFGDEGEEEEEEANHEERAQEQFRLKPQYEGKRGQQLMELSSKFGGDERFRIDERFAEEDDASVGGAPDDEETAEGEGGLSDKQVQLNVLNEMFGPSIASSSSTTPTNSSSKSYCEPGWPTSLGLVRYQPSSEEHKRKYEMKPEAESGSRTSELGTVTSAKHPPNTSKVDHLSVNAPETPKQKRPKRGQKAAAPEEKKIVNNEKATYTVASNLKQLFSESSAPAATATDSTSAPASTAGFSVLGLFGTATAAKSKEETSKKVKGQESAHLATKEVRSEKATFWNSSQPNPFKYDSSDDEEEEDTKKKSPVAVAQPITAAASRPQGLRSDESKLFQPESFFFKPNDSRLSNVFQSFLSSNENVEEIHKRFNDGGGRAELKTIVKAKWKNSKRKNEKRVRVIKLLKKKKRRDAVKKLQHVEKIRAIKEQREQQQY